MCAVGWTPTNMTKMPPFSLRKMRDSDWVFDFGQDKCKVTLVSKWGRCSSLFEWDTENVQQDFFEIYMG